MASTNAQTHFRWVFASTTPLDVGCADDRAPRALLGVYLKEVECPEQMLWVPTPWLELVTNKELPDDLDHSLASSEELVEEPGLWSRSTTRSRCNVVGGS